jgi:CopC domain
VTVTYAAPLAAAGAARVVAGGRDVAGTARLDPGDARRLVIPLTAAGPLAYRATWTAIGADGHSLAGATSFTVRAPPAVAAAHRLALRLREAATRVGQAVSAVALA